MHMQFHIHISKVNVLIGKLCLSKQLLDAFSQHSIQWRLRHSDFSDSSRIFDNDLHCKT